MIGIIGGTGVIGSGLVKAKERRVKTKYGTVTIIQTPNYYFLQRHAKGVQPHMINHKANIEALRSLGVKESMAISSVGSLKKEIKPGDLVVIDDYMQLSGIPTFFDKKIMFTRPAISEELRARIIAAAKKLKLKVHSKGTYIQTHGPRYETKAEIRLFAHYADVVGMTIASEATLANEAEIEYACICSVDNYAHGLSADKISWGLITKNQKRNLVHLSKLLAKVTE